MSHNCVQSRLVKTLLAKNEHALRDFLSAEVEVSLIIDHFTLKPKYLQLLLRESNGSGVWEEIQLLHHRGEFCSRRQAISHKDAFQTSLSSHPSSLPLVSCCELNLTFGRYGVTDNRHSTA
jgi:hypothetical protein